MRSKFFFEQQQCAQKLHDDALRQVDRLTSSIFFVERKEIETKYLVF